MTALRSGINAPGLARSAAVGFTGGIFPIPGTTTIICILMCQALHRWWKAPTNIVITQLVNVLVLPIELALIPAFMYLGRLVFSPGSAAVPVDELIKGMKQHPLTTLWHGLGDLLIAVVVWTVLSPIIGIIIYSVAKPCSSMLLKAYGTGKYASSNVRDEELEPLNTPVSGTSSSPARRSVTRSEN